MTHSGGGNRRGTRASFGSIRKLPSGRYQARYTGPDEIVRRAPVTFDAKVDAESWLATLRAAIVGEVWNPPPARPRRPPRHQRRTIASEQPHVHVIRARQVHI